MRCACCQASGASIQLLNVIPDGFLYCAACIYHNQRDNNVYVSSPFRSLYNPPHWEKEGVYLAGDEENDG